MELVNREEVFNKKFWREPIVGVMQVVKPKNIKPKAPAAGNPISAFTSGVRILFPLHLTLFISIHES
jgi:hypothetical protein